MIAPEHGHDARLLHDRRGGRTAAPAPRARRGRGREPEPDHGGRRHLDQRHGGGAGERRASGARAIEREGADFDAFRARARRGGARGSRCMLVRDGEGVTRIAEVRVEGARRAKPRPTGSRAPWPSPRSSRRRSTAATPTGAASWPPSAAPAWRSTSAQVSIWSGDVWVAEGGAARDYDEARRAAAMREDPVRHPRPRSARARPRAGCGPPTSRTATWTSMRTTGAEAA